MFKKLSFRVQKNYVDKESSRWAESPKTLKTGPRSQVSRHAVPSHYEELQKRRQLRKQEVAAEEPHEVSQVTELPPTLLSGQEGDVASAEPISGDVTRASRPSMMDGLRRRTVKFRQWLGKLVSAKSFGPGVDLEDSCCSSEEEAASGNATAVTKNHFLAAYLTGDLDVLDSCLQASAGQHGKRSFIAIAQERGEISLDDWLRTFHATSMKKKLKEMSGVSYQEDLLRRAFVVLQHLTADPRRQLGDRSKEAKNTKGKPADQNVVIFTDFEEAPHQVLWAKRLGERLVRGTEAAVLNRESVRTALSETLAKALDGVDPALRLARAAARAARRGLWLDTSAELRCLWALSALEPEAVHQALVSSKHPGGRYLGFVIRHACRKILSDQGTSPSSADQEETLLLGLLLAKELGRQHRSITAKGVASMGSQEVADSTLMDALQPKSFLLSLAVIIHLLDREVIPRDDQICGNAFWQKLASQLLGTLWPLVDQAYESSPLRLQLAQLARATGLSPPSRDCDEANSPLALRAAAVASGSHKAHLGQHLPRPARVPEEGLGPLMAIEATPATAPASSLRTRNRDKLQTDDAKRAEEALDQVCTCLEEMEETTPALFKSLVFYGAPFLADRLVRDFPSCQEKAKSLIGQLKDALVEVGAAEADALEASPSRHRRRQIGGNNAREAEIREVRRSWDAEMEMQWFDLLRLSADSEDDDDDDAKDEESMLVLP